MKNIQVTRLRRNPIRSPPLTSNKLRKNSRTKPYSSIGFLRKVMIRRTTMETTMNQRWSRLSALTSVPRSSSDPMRLVSSTFSSLSPYAKNRARSAQLVVSARTMRQSPILFLSVMVEMAMVLFSVLFYLIYIEVQIWYFASLRFFKKLEVLNPSCCLLVMGRVSYCTSPSSFNGDEVKWWPYSHSGSHEISELHASIVSFQKRLSYPHDVGQGKMQTPLNFPRLPFFSLFFSPTK